MSDHRPSITIDPGVQVGHPCVTGTRVEAATVAEAHWGRIPVDDLCDDYGIYRADVLWCCAWWAGKDGWETFGDPALARRRQWRKWATHAGLVLGGHRPGVGLCDPDDYDPATTSNTRAGKLTA